MLTGAVALKISIYSIKSFCTLEDGQLGRNLEWEDENCTQTGKDAKRNKLNGFQSASKLCRPSGSLLSVKLVSNFGGRGVTRDQLNRYPQPLTSVF
jgi:hypothetical protein